MSVRLAEAVAGSTTATAPAQLSPEHGSNGTVDLRVASLASVLLQGMALLEFHRQPLPPGVQGRWETGFHLVWAVALCLSFLLPFLLPLLRAGFGAVPLLLLRFGLVAVAGYPLGPSVVVEDYLIAALLVETGCFVPKGASVPLCVAFSVAMLLLQHDADAWGMRLRGPAPLDLLHLGSVCALCTAASVLFRESRRRSGEARSLAEHLRDSVVRLTTLNLGFQNHAVEAASLSAERERQRIAREVHDSVGYSFSTIFMMIEAAAALTALDPQRTVLTLRKAQEHMNDSLQDIRLALRELHKRKGEYLRGVRALTYLAKTFESATAVRVRLQYGNLPWELPDVIDLLLYRLVQEGLTNAFRHGRATEVSVMLWMNEDELAVTIEDNGRGAAVVEEGVGLSGIRQRVGSLGGALVYKARPDGFSLCVRVPLVAR